MYNYVYFRYPSLIPRPPPRFSQISTAARLLSLFCFHLWLTVCGYCMCGTNQCGYIHFPYILVLSVLMTAQSNIVVPDCLNDDDDPFIVVTLASFIPLTCKKCQCMGVTPPLYVCMHRCHPETVYIYNYCEIFD